MNKSEIALNAIRAEKGDQSAITALYNYTYPGMYRLLYNLCGSRETAEDILQESYLKAFGGLHKLRSKWQFYSWLRIIVVNTWINYAKQNKNVLNEVPLDMLDESDRVSDSAVYYSSELSERNRDLWEAVDSLPENQRICVVLFYYNEMSVDDISKALDIPKGSVKSRLYYARLKLRNYLGDRMVLGGMAAAAQGGGSETMLKAILEALANTGGSHAAASGMATGILFKFAAGAVSVGLLAGGVLYTTDEMKKRQKNSGTNPIVTTYATTTTSAVDTSAATTSSSAPLPSSTTSTFAKTTAHIPNDFGWREVEGGAEILSFSGDDVNVVIPARIQGKTVVSIASGAFYGRGDIKSVDIPSSVLRIGDNAFRDCKGMTSLRLHSGLAKIGDMAFLGCESLTSVSIPGSVGRVGIYAFAYCNNLKTVVLGDGVKNVGYCAFRECVSLQRVTLPESVTDIGNAAFDGCNGSLTLVVRDGTYSHDYGISEGINVEIS